MAAGGKAHNAVVLGVVDVEGDVFVGESYNKSVGTGNGEVAKQGTGEIALAWLVIGVSRQGAAGQHLDMRPVAAIDSAKSLGDGGSQRLCLALRKIFIGLQVDGKGGGVSAGSAGSEADRRPVHAAQHRARKTRKR